MKQPDQAIGRAQFDAICPGREQSPSAYFFQVLPDSAKTLFVFLEDEAFAAQWKSDEQSSLVILLPEAWDRPEHSLQDVYLSFSRFLYEERVWNLTDPDEFRSLLSHFFGGAEEFLVTYKAVCRRAIEHSGAKIAFGLEGVGRLLGDKIRKSPLYRKTMLDLADELAGRGFAICYATGHTVCDLSPFVLRRLSELRGDILPASFAASPGAVGRGIAKTIQAIKAAGFGSYIIYSNRERMRLPCAIPKETL